MARATPLRSLHESAGAALRTYGPPEARIELVEAFDPVEAEYGALRKQCGLIDLPSRGTIEVRGADRVAFINRMVTQELKGLAPMEARRSFWLNRKGRIDADLRILELGGRMLIDVDAHAAAATVAALSSYLFSEDVQIEDQTDAWHRLALHGPAGPSLLSAIAAPGGERPDALAAGRACALTIAGREVIVDRQDSAATVGLELLIRRDDAADVYGAISESTPGADATGHRRSMDGRTGLARRIGWHAYNIARIEGGWPVFNIDFGPDSLPHETGVLEDRVSFKKGCYLGQEVVARMQSLGHPKQRLVALRIDGPSGQPDGDEARLPEAGASVLTSHGAGEAKPAEVVGAVTSSALSPMLSGAPIALAMVKYKHIAPGTRLFVEAEGGVLACTVRPRLAFWPE